MSRATAAAAGSGVQVAGRLEQAVDAQPQVVPVGRRLDVEVAGRPPHGLGQGGVHQRAGVGRAGAGRRPSRAVYGRGDGQQSVLVGRRGRGKFPVKPAVDPISGSVSDVYLVLEPVPVKLTYAPRPGSRPAAERAAAVFTAVAAVAVIGSGSIAWALMMRHH